MVSLLLFSSDVLLLIQSLFIICFLSVCLSPTYLKSGVIMTPLLFLNPKINLLSSITSQDHFRDLGVIFSSDLSWTEHYNTLTAKAYQTLGLVRQSFSLSVPIRVKKCLFLSLVRSRLTYCSQVWRPSLIKDICLLEQIQWRNTKYILNDYQSDYKSRLISLNILPLIYTYELLDILFLVHSLKQPDPCLPINDYISFSSSSTRAGHTLKLIHQHSLTSLSSHSYFKRVARLWNALPLIDLNCSLPTIKFHLKQFLWNHFIDSFNPDLPCTYHFLCPRPKCAQMHRSLNFTSTHP